MSTEGWRSSVVHDGGLAEDGEGSRHRSPSTSTKKLRAAAAGRQAGRRRRWPVRSGACRSPGGRAVRPWSSWRGTPEPGHRPPTILNREVPFFISSIRLPVTVRTDRHRAPLPFDPRHGGGECGVALSPEHEGHHCVAVGTGLDDRITRSGDDLSTIS